MNPLEAKLISLIAAEGPIPFSRFMEISLYDPTHGFYRRDVFGRSGHFFTASQLQPVFGAFVRSLALSLDPTFESFIDLGAGRGELRSSFTDKNYKPIDLDQSIPALPRPILFANELFDALPIDLTQDGQLLRVTHNGERFVWHPQAPSDGVIEHCPSLSSQLERAYAALPSGFFLIIDYGYRSRERMRFPQGTLMSYQNHIASPDVLLSPGLRDITAHVDWDALTEAAISIGWSFVSLSSIHSALLSMGPQTLESIATSSPEMFKTFLHSFASGFDLLILRKPA